MKTIDNYDLHKNQSSEGQARGIACTTDGCVRDCEGWIMGRCIIGPASKLKAILDVKLGYAAQGGTSAVG